MALDMWLAVGSDARPPARGNLMPESIAGVLADTWLMDYSAETRDLRYRLVGENIRSRYDFPLVGKHIGEILAPEARDRVLGYFRACVEKPARSEEHTSELQSLMRISYAVFCLKKKKKPVSD